MKDEDFEFSSLKTVSKFDRGEPLTVALDVAPNDLRQFSPSSLFVESLIEEICRLMEKDPKDQRTLYLSICESLHQRKLIGESYGKEEYQFMRSHYQQSLIRLLTTAKSTTTECKALCTPNLSLIVPYSHSRNAFSRYENEFDELKFIAGGGFGEVYEAKNKLDGEIYAIKKILLRFADNKSFYENLQEVKTLAKLNHPNVVSYKNAWLEVNTDISSRASDFIINEVDVSSTESSKDSFIVFEHSAQSANISNNQMNLPSKKVSDSDSSESPDNVALCEYGSKSHFQKRFKHIYQQKSTLYIQMQLCPMNLRCWLDERNSVNGIEADMDQCIEIFKQVVCGVKYIHSQNIVHHDIKPSNIFISSDLKLIQVGDFGLACNLCLPVNTMSIVSTHERFGTKPYAAPEQLAGCCSSKSDIYSLGIVLFELAQPFLTSMERNEKISQLKSGRIPTQLAANNPDIAMVISRTTSTSCRERPSSEELLEQLELDQIEQMRQEIVSLRRVLLAKDEEIASLKKQVKQQEMN